MLLRGPHKVRLCKNAEKNCSEAGSYYSCPACRNGIMRTGSCAADFRPDRVISLADTVIRDSFPEGKPLLEIFGIYIKRDLLYN